jgi:hypothetical protein
VKSDRKIEERTERRCQRCSKKLLPGSLAYVVQIEVFSDFDGVLPEAVEDLEQQLREWVEEAEESDPEALEMEVHEAFSLLLCKSCRDRFVDETRHPWEGPFRILKDPGPLLH